MNRAELILFLGSYKDLTDEYNLLKKELDEWKNRTVSSPAKERISKGKGDTVLNAVSRIDEVEAMIDNRLESLSNMRIAIDHVIGSLDGKQKEVLYRKYILGQTFEKLSEEMDISERNSRRLRDRAITKLLTISAVAGILPHKTS